MRVRVRVFMWNISMKNSLTFGCVHFNANYAKTDQRSICEHANNFVGVCFFVAVVRKHKTKAKTNVSTFDTKSNE